MKRAPNLAKATALALFHALGIKPGAIVIDVGTTEVNGKLEGDVEFEEAKKVFVFSTDSANAKSIGPAIASDGLYVSGIPLNFLKLSPN